MPHVIHPKPGLIIDLDVVAAESIKDSTYAGESGHFNLDTFAPYELVTHRRTWMGSTLYDHYSIGGWTAEAKGRKVFGGAMVEGPHAYVFEKGTVISARQFDYERDMISIYFEEGSRIRIKGTVYQVHFPQRPGQKNKYPELTPVNELVEA